MNAYRDAMRRYADFRGRSTRAQFWVFSLTLLVLLIAGSILDVLFGFDREGALVITAIVYLAHLIPTVAVTVRRLHDIDRSGWWFLIAPVPIIGTIALIVFACTASTAGANRFGPHPDASAADARGRGRTGPQGAGQPQTGRGA